ncbi:mechanosensitive ion channel family protein [Isoalcanivorax beigongshangi]|uniref:Small-conductance mechanosensitive channel n=1 Tax=Isoalcanivorax beigongshangi TaxID=3238810 RepID=A0ABV4AGF4_9GAMM
MVELLAEYVQQHTFMRILSTVLALIILFGGASLARRLARRFGEMRGYPLGRTFQVTVLINVVTLFIVFFTLSGIWGFTGQGFMVVASSFFALVGIALFAAWSILSNVTAAFILFFSSPYGVGDRIRVLDGDNTVTGRVRHMGLIYLTLEDPDGHRYTLPNNILLQKTVIRLANNRELPIDKKHCR